MKTNNKGCLIHWGGVRRDHKYIERIKKPDGKYRYFYTREEYDAYLEEKRASKNPFSVLSKGLSNLTNEVKKGVDEAKKGISGIAKTASELTSKGYDFLNNKLSNIFKKTPLSKIFDKPKAVKRGESFVNSMLRTIRRTDIEIYTGQPKKHKYLARVERKDGSYRYFYEQNEYEAYLERQTYQDTEPDFMKDVKELDADYDPVRDVFDTNPKYMDSVKNGDLKYTTNCWLSSNTYELRKRGYDVEAGDMNESKLDMVTYFYNPRVPDSKAKAIQNSFSRWYKNPATKMVPTDNLDKTLRTFNPPGSRGQLNIQWKGGGGHSLVYEVDDDRKVSIIDSQTHRVYRGNSIKELTDRIDDVCYTRTDNLELKEGILDVIEKKR